MDKILAAARDNFVSEAEAARDALQEKLDDLEEKQGEKETEARGEKIEELTNQIGVLEDAIDAAIALE